MVVFGASAALVAVVVVAVVLIANPFAQSMSELVAGRLDGAASCSAAGYEELAGEREKVWTCSYWNASDPMWPGHGTLCAANVEGDVMLVREDAC
jgi:hypothetical protein